MIAVALTETFFFIERLVNRLTARAVAQTDPAMILHCVRIDAVVTTYLLQKHTHTHIHPDQHKQRTCLQRILFLGLCAVALQILP